MVSDHPSPQRIARLTPLADVLTWIDANVRPVRSRKMIAGAAIGRVLASDVKAPHAIPPHPISLRDGYALQSDWTSDASSYAPAPLPHMPKRVDAGDPLPPGTDCVAALDHIAIKGKRAEALSIVAPGEGILPAGSDIAANDPFLHAGEMLRAHHDPILNAANLCDVRIRIPRVGVIPASHVEDAAIITTAMMIMTELESVGAIAMDNEETFESALQEKGPDAIIAIGGTGTGRHDNAVATLAHAGTVAFHGIGLMPGETAAIGIANGKAVLLLPGRVDAALACWLVLGRRMLTRLAGGTIDDVTTPLKLSRKVTSTIGIADVVLLKRSGGDADPLASGTWPMQALAQADSYYVVPPESEGFPAGAVVNASPLP